ncbi:MAG: hypothetical protein JXB15_13960 [Anaerolineales bacterium]|nr:hypothetical protein [Anaerolineales bacterium]
MKLKTMFTGLVLLGFLLGSTSASQALAPSAPAATPLGTAFSYQGYLTDSGQPAEGAYDFKFSLWADSGAGTQIGADILADDQTVSNGYFTVLLDFGAGSFQGDKRWLKIEVRPGASSGAYTPIASLQELTATPYALHARTVPWNGIAAMPPSFADGLDNNTQYLAGTGLQISGADPTYTFSVDNALVQARVSSSCPTGQAIRVINQNGTVQCQDTDYTQGMGIQISARQISADTTYLQRRVSGTCTPGSSIRAVNPDGTVSCEPDDDTTYTAGWGLNLVAGAFSVNSSQVQQRVTGSCRPGSSVQAVNADGTVVCWDDAPLNRPVPPANFVQNNPIPTSWFGQTNQVTIGANGLPFILFADNTDGFYKLVACQDMACSTSKVTTIDVMNLGSDYASMALDPAGRIQIAYYNVTVQDLWFARCVDIACTSVVNRPLVFTPADEGVNNDMVIAADGFALVVYENITTGALEAVHCLDADCTAVMPATIIDPMAPKADPAITLGADGLGLVAYHFTPSFDLKIAHCSDIACSLATLSLLATLPWDGYQPTITTGVDGLGLIAAVDIDSGNIYTVHCTNLVCNTLVGPQLIHVLWPGHTTPIPMITISAAGLGVLTFVDYIGGNITQVVAHCNDLPCSAVSESTWIASQAPPAITITPSGVPLLTAPAQAAPAYLQVTLCGDVFCAEFFRRR